MCQKQIPSPFVSAEREKRIEPLLAKSHGMTAFAAIKRSCDGSSGPECGTDPMERVFRDVWHIAEGHNPAGGLRRSAYAGGQGDTHAARRVFYFDDLNV